MKVASFLKDIKFNELKPAVKLLSDTDFSKEIRVVFAKDQIMEDHQAPFAITVQVIAGEIDFGTVAENVILFPGDLVSLKPHVVHNLKANEDSVVRLTLSKLDTVKRVKEI